MVRALRADAHFFQSEANLPPYVFPVIQRGNIEIPGFVMGEKGGFPFFIGTEQIEFTFWAEQEPVPIPSCFFYGMLQDTAAIAFTAVVAYLLGELG